MLLRKFLLEQLNESTFLIFRGILFHNLVAVSLFYIGHTALKLAYVYRVLRTFRTLLLRLPVGRGGVINSPRSIFLGFFSVSEVGLPLMGDTAGTKLHEPI